MSDLQVFTHTNHNHDQFHRNLDVGGDWKLFIPQLSQYRFHDRDGNESGHTLNDNITSLIVGPDVFVRLYTDNSYGGNHESFLPNDAPSKIFISNGHSSMKMWKMNPDDHNQMKAMLGEINSGV